MPSATPEELAAAISDCIEGGAGVINLSVGLAHLSSNGKWMSELEKEIVLEFARTDPGKIEPDRTRLKNNILSSKHDHQY